MPMASRLVQLGSLSKESLMFNNLVLREFYKGYSTTKSLQNAKPPNILVFSNDLEESFKLFQQTLNSILKPDKYLVYHLKSEDVLQSPWQENNEALILIENAKKIEVQTKISDWLSSTEEARFLHLTLSNSEILNSNESLVLDESISENKLEGVGKKIVILNSFREVSREFLRKVLHKSLGLEIGSENGSSSAVSQTKGFLFAKRDEIKNDFLQKLKENNFQNKSVSVQNGEKNFQLKDFEVEIKPDCCSYKSFDLCKYFSKLKTKKLGALLIHSNIMNSSFDPFQCFPGEFQNGLAVIPDRQLQGRGRGGNQWLSPEGCAMFTVQICISRRSRLGQHTSLLCHMASLAIAQTLNRHFPSSGNSPPNIGIKWPNDIYFRSKLKIGGILVLTSFLGNDDIIANVGAGLNLDNSDPNPGLNPMLSSSSDCLAKAEYLAETFNNLESIIDDYQSGGDLFSKWYQQFWLHQDQHVQVQVEGEEEPLNGKVIGIDEFGFLRVFLGDRQEIISVQPDGNSFDMMKGLIYPKMRN